MSRIYFDITDIVHFASRNNRLTGIQRVQFNIVNLLARRHGGNAVRCIYFERVQRTIFEFDPSLRANGSEFDAESLLIDLGLAQPSTRYPSKVRIKSYLRKHARSKLQRICIKVQIYIWSWAEPQWLRDADLLPSIQLSQLTNRLAPKKINALPANSHLVHLGSSWFFPEAWKFAAAHRARGGDVVQYIHDLIPVTHPQFMPDKEPPVFVNWLQHAMEYATRFPCNSQWTAKDLLKFAEQDGRELNVHVVPLAHEFVGFARNDNPDMPERLAELKNRPFILCVGTIEARKNGLALLRVWQHLLYELGEHTPLLVFAGRYGKIGGPAVEAFIAKDPKLQQNIRVVDAPSDQALAWLYRHCRFSVYPSFVEGWGLPVGESAWFGRYCVASQASSVPEVCGDLMGYVDPDDLDGIKRGILQPLAEPALLAEREQAIANAPLRSWQQVADDLYEYIVGQVASQPKKDI